MHLDSKERTTRSKVEKESEMFGRALYYSVRASVLGLVVTGYAMSVFQFSGVA
jgi:hypothetical protein